METVWIAVISGIFGFIGSLISYKLQQKRMQSEIKKTNAEASEILVGSSLELLSKMQESVKEHEKKIHDLEEELEKLKASESIHINEKKILSKQIKYLEEENRALLIRNKEHKKEIIGLQQEIISLEKEIKKLKVK